MTRLVFAVIAVCGLSAHASAQTTVTLGTPGTHISVDTYIQGGTAANTDNSKSAALASKQWSDNYTRRIFLKFDTENYIPANATIKSAYLHLVLKYSETKETRTFTAYNVTKSFSKGETTWNQAKSGSPWAKKGGDLGGSYGTTAVGDAEGWTYKFDLTKLVQESVSGKFGSRYTRLALVDSGGESDGSYKEFFSTRASNSAYRPRLVVTYTTGSTSSSGSTSSGSSTSTPPPSSSTGSTLKVMQWNVHKTNGTDGVCNPDRVATVIAAQRPDVVSLNEVNFYSGACAYTFDMGEKLRSLVAAKTGQTWYKQNVNVYGGSSGYGNVVLSRFAPAVSQTKSLSYSRGVAMMGIYVNGKMVNIFSTHFEYTNASWRPIQMNEALRYTYGFSAARIIMGDFNTNPGTSDYNILANVYQDAWKAGTSAGTAWAYNGSGATHGGSRFDYVMYAKSAGLTLKSVSVVSAQKGSDHDPVVAVFSVN